MPHLYMHLVDARDTYVTEVDALTRKIWFDALITDADFFIKDPIGDQFVEKCCVIFIFNHGSGTSGALRYSGSWKDPDTGKIDKGICEISISSPSELIEFLTKTPDRRCELHLHLNIDADYQVVQVMCGEVQWDPAIENPVKVEVLNIGWVPAHHSNVVRNT